MRRIAAVLEDRCIYADIVFDKNETYADGQVAYKRTL